MRQGTIILIRFSLIDWLKSGNNIIEELVFCKNITAYGNFQDFQYSNNFTETHINSTSNTKNLLCPGFN